MERDFQHATMHREDIHLKLLNKHRIAVDDEALKQAFIRALVRMFPTGDWSEVESHATRAWNGIRWHDPKPWVVVRDEVRAAWNEVKSVETAGHSRLG